jgi:hypothetical protein
MSCGKRKHVRPALALLLLLASAGCVTKPEQVVRAAAAQDLSCPDDKITLTNLDGGTKKHFWQGKFRADGCGKTENYVCTEWDSYNQAPLCHRGTE